MGVNEYLIDGLIEARRRHRDQSIAKRAQIAGDSLIRDDGILLANFGGGLETEFHILLRRVLVLRQFERGLRDDSRHGQRQQHGEDGGRAAWCDRHG